MTRCSVLVVDDDPAILHTVAEFLDLEGFPVATAANGAQAVEAVERQTPNIVLLDMRMPVLDGWGFARTMEERGRSLPILVMTAAQDTKRWAEEIGAAGYVSKPFDLLDLLRAVEALCARVLKGNALAPG